VRALLLWMAGNRWLREYLPRLWFAKRAVRRFMPGEDVESALAAADRYRTLHRGTLFTHLGENLSGLDEADSEAEHYLGLIDQVRSRGIDGEISVKLTHLGFDLDLERTFAHLERLCARASEAGQTVWIDMESSAYCEGTVDFYARLLARHKNTGLCLQAYLRRTPADLQRLIPLEPRIRLVKGAYAEPEDVAFQARHDVDTAYLGLTVSMLDAVKSGRPVRIGLGTHDLRLVEQAAAHAEALGLGRAAFEVQMLYGIREKEQRRLVDEGYTLRTLISYGEAWYPWYVRRLAERPANVLFALRQMVPW
jgi:proline dehydrogenase